MTKLDKFLPFISLLALFFYYLFENFSDSKTVRFVFLIVSVAFILSDLIYRVIVQGFRNVQYSRFISSGLGVTAILLFQLRIWLDFPAKAGVVQEATIIPQIREFLLALTVILSMAFLIYTVFLEIGRMSLEAQSVLSDKKRNLLQNSIFGFIILIPILIAVNYIAVQRNYNFDLSESGKYSLSPISKSILRELSKDIEIIAFYPRPLEADGPGGSLALARIRPNLEIMLDQYSASSSKIKVRFINADVETDLLSGFGQVSNGLVLVRSKKENLVSEQSPYVEEKVSVKEQSDLNTLERRLTSAIINVSTPKRKAYFTSANGERYGTAFQNLTNEKIGQFVTGLTYLNFQIKELGFSENWPAESIPDDADLLVIVGPTVPFNDKSQTAILNYVNQRNGKVFISLEPQGKEDMNWLLGKAGVKFNPTQLSQTEGRAGFLVARDFPSHPISESLPKKEQGVVFPFVGSFETFTQPNIPFDFTSKFIMESIPDTFLDPKGTGKLDSNSNKSKFNLAVILQSISNKEESKLEGRVAVFSGTSWITDQFIGYNMNRSMALGTITWLYQNSVLNEIPEKKEEIKTINLTDKQKLMVWVIGMFLYPGSIILIGSYFVVSRRKSEDMIS
ncbi:Gldg family protein [Leptospira sp. GIMC2001]|uniref:Gldg family protein n=1 Tax=Leptospira sp. GIMC2001 TaxID=1513297 RepID=UPI00234B2E29|nr:Gldg family protein [Leptospira sp. GIMC2001]WCL50033.1 Gldg family protein [Leptospira sp. GIMC2001]